MRTIAGIVLAGSAFILPHNAFAQSDRPVFREDGGVEVPAFTLPPSSFLSAEALAAQKLRSRLPPTAPMPGDVHQFRADVEAMFAPKVARMRAVYPVAIEEQVIGRVPVRVVTPAKGKPDAKRVLINLHGGAFSICADACAILESTPIAALSGIQVISVNYRQAPEARHPAAVEDVASVYRELLRQYAPGNIGIFGCSAGGELTAQAAAWLPEQGLPQAGAIGIFGAGAITDPSGDSDYLSPYVDGVTPAPGPERASRTRGYFDTVKAGDPIISAALHPEVLARFPPTLIVSGTRAYDLSAAAVTNSALLKAGISSTLLVAEGMNHCYIYEPDFPEARDAHRIIAEFFRSRLK